MMQHDSITVSPSAASGSHDVVACTYLHKGSLPEGVQVGPSSVHTGGHRLGQLPHNAAQGFISTSILLLKQLAGIKE